MAIRVALLDRMRRPKPTSPAGAKPKAQPKPKAAAKPRPKAAPKAGTKGRANPKRTSTSRPRPRPRVRKPPPPVLQRRTLGSTLARAAVLAVAVVCTAAFAVALAKVTLVPSPASDALIHTNLRPGASIRAYLDQPALRDTVKQIGGNIVLGVPFGILLPTLFPRARGLLRVAVLTGLVMVVVEAVQGEMVEGRAFDIDDVILNTLGALLGYLLLGRRLGSALHPHRTHWWQRFRHPPSNRR